MVASQGSKSKQIHRNGNLTFIGMAGVGKTTFGKALAKATQKDFIDVDPYIEKKHGATLQELIDTHGLDYFKKIEEEAILELGDLQNTVISPGGSIVYYPGAMAWLKEHTTVVYLKDDLENIKKRIPNLESRGIVGLKEKGLQGVFDERCGLYEANQHYTFTLSAPFNKSDILERLIRELDEKNFL